MFYFQLCDIMIFEVKYSNLNQANKKFWLMFVRLKFNSILNFLRSFTFHISQNPSNQSFLLEKGKKNI